MKNVLIIMLLVLSSCTQSNNSGSSPDSGAPSSSFEIDIAKQQLDDNLFVTPGFPLELGTASPAVQTLTAVLTLKNSGNSVEPLNISMDSENGFSMKLNRCGTSLNKNATCQVTIQFSSRGLFTGPQNSAITINNNPFPLHAIVSGQDNPDNSGIPHLKLSLNAPFDPLNGNPNRILTITNDGNGTASNFSTELSADYIIVISRCASTLKPGKSCIITVGLKNYRQNPVAPPNSPIVVTIPNYPPSTLDLKTNEIPTGVGHRVVQVAEPQLGIIKSSDGFISCGNGSHSCNHDYANAPTSLQMSVTDLGEGILGNINVYSDNTQTFTSSIFSINLSQVDGPEDYSFYVSAEVSLPQKYNLTLRIRGGKTLERLNITAGSVSDSCEGTCNYSIKEGTQISVTAASGAGKNFVRWVDCPSAAGQVCSLTLGGEKEVVAEFESGYSMSSSLVNSTSEMFGDGSTSYKYPDGDYIYSYSYQSHHMQSFNFNTHVLSNIGPSLPDQGVYYRKYNGKYIFASRDQNSNTTKIFSLSGNAYAEIANFPCMVQNIPENGLAISDNQKSIVQCFVSGGPTGTMGKYYIVDLDSGSMNLFYTTPVLDAGTGRMVDYDFTTGEFILFRITPGDYSRGLYKYSSDGTLIGTISGPNSGGIDDFIKYGSNLVVSGSGGTYSVPLDFSATDLNYLAPGNVGNTMISKNNKDYVVSSTGVPTLINLVDLTTQSAPQDFLNALSSSSQATTRVSADPVGLTVSSGGSGGKVFDINLDTFALTRLIDLPNNSDMKVTWDVASSSDHYVFGTKLYNSSGLDSKKKNGTIMKVSKINPRLSREIFKLDTESMVEQNSYSIDSYLGIVTLVEGSSGEIMVETYERDYPGGVTRNIMKRYFLFPN